MNLAYNLSKVICVVAMFLILSLVGCDKREHRASQYTYYCTAQDYKNQGDLLKAFENANLVLKYAQLDGDSTFVLKCRILLASLYYITCQDHESYELIKDINLNQIKDLDESSRANFYSMKSYFAAIFERDFSSAFLYNDSLMEYHKTIEIRPNNEILLAHDSANLIGLYILNSDTAKAWSLLRTLKSKENSLNDLQFSENLNLNRAKLFFQENKLDSAVKYATMIRKRIPCTQEDPYNGLIVLSILMSRDSLIGNLSQYIMHRNEYDSIVNIEHENEIKYKLQALKGEMMAEDILQKVHYERKIATVWIIFIVVVALFIILIGFLFYRNRKNKHELALLECDRLDSEIRIREQENQHLRVELNDQHSQLDAVLQETAELKRLLATKVNGAPKDGEQMINLLRTSQPAFLQKLRTTHPNLNHNEEILIAMIRLDMTTSEIASVLNISQESLIKSRYRLRKKMGIASSKELNQTIREL